MGRLTPALLFLLTACAPSSQPDDPLLRLQESLEQYRPFEALLSHGTSTACASDIKSAICAEASLPSGDLAYTAGQLVAEFQSSGSTDALHHVVLIDLLFARDARQVRQILANSARLGERTDVTAPQLNDLGVATLVDAVDRGSARGLLESVELFDRAIELDPAFGPAQFNLGLALQRLTLLHSAVSVWERLEQSGAFSGHLAEEVTRRRVAAQTELDRRRPVVAGASWDVEFDSLLIAWATAVEEQDEGKADQSLADLSSLAEAYRGRDGFLTLAFDELASLDVEQRAARAEYYRAQAVAGRLQRERLYEDSVHELDIALLLPRESAIRSRAQLLRLAVDVVRADYEAIPRLVELAQPRFHGALRGRVHWMLGTALSRIDELDRSAQHYALAEEDYEAVGDSASAAVVLLGQLAVLIAVGDSEEIDRVLLPGLLRIRAAPSALFLHTTMTLTSQLAVDWGLAGAGIWVAREDYAVVVSFDEDLLLPETLTGLAGRLVDRQPDTVANLLTAARNHLDAVADPTMRRVVEAFVDLLTAEALASHEDGAASAIGFFDEAIDHYAQHPPGNIVRALVGRASAAHALELHELGISSSERALEFARIGFSNLSAPHQRAHLRSSLDGAIDLLTSHAYERSPIEALAIQEDARALVSSGGSIAPDDALLWMEAQPAGSVVLAYASLDEETLAWVVRDGALAASARIDVGADELDALGRGAADPRPSISNEAIRKLSSLLLDPIRPALDGAQLVAVVPDGALRGVPFGALLDPDTGERLFEAQPVVSVASGRHFVEATLAAQRRALSHDQRRGVFVAGIEVDNLPRLPGALREVDELTAIYPTGATRGEGNLESLRDDLAGATIVHFAGHTTFDPLNPALSRLALKRDDDDESFARVRELVEAGGEELRLVVLSACSTDRVDRTQAAAPWNVGQEALAMGVPGVLVSLWPVDDDATRSFMLEFHRALLTGLTPAEALQAAQRTMSQSDDPRLARVQSWAGFRLIGV